MDTYEKIEELIAHKYGKSTTTRKSIGDFMLAEDHAVNVKSNNINKKNYSPNMMSIKQLHKWVFEEKKKLSFIFVDYEENGNDFKIINESDPIPIHHICWDCLSIEAQGYGVIQKVADLKINTNQTMRQFYEGFITEYNRFRNKETVKHEKFSSRFILDLDSLDII